MLLKLAARNIRRSVRDYAIYFVTLVFGVAVFYAFNSIGSQQVLFDISQSSAQSIFNTTQTMLNGLSVFIAFVLGFLIVYANRFLIKRRKHEFGIYLTLGMSPRSVSLIVLGETTIVGLVSLAVGLICGILASQALAFATAALFGMRMAGYQFVFSPDALFATIACFIIIYVVVALFNLLAVNRFKLIDLLSASSRNEKDPVRNPWVCLAVFVVSIGVLAFAYNRLIVNGLVYLDDPDFYLATAGMLVGSLLFFWSLAGFVVNVLQRARGVYLRGLTVFTVRQIASKINTAFLSLWVTCVMLFFSITIFSTGMGLIEVFYGDSEEANPYDATISSEIYFADPVDIAHPTSETLDERARALEQSYPEVYADGSTHNWDMGARLSESVPGWSDVVAKSAQIDRWEVPGTTYGQLLEKANSSTGDADTDEAISPNNLAVASLSQVNDLLELQGEKPLELRDGTIVLANNMAMTENLARDIAKSGVVVDMMGRTFTMSENVADIQIQNNAMLATAVLFIVPDEVVDELRGKGAIPLSSYLNVMYPDGMGNAEGDAALKAGLAEEFPVEGSELEGGTAHADDVFGRGLWPITNLMTSLEMTSQAGGLRMLITYLAVYIGFVFLIATAAVLAIQQLSEAADSQERYRLLARLGCDERMLSRSVLVQVLVYFLSPLALAVCHSACAISVMSDSLFDLLGVEVFGPILMAGAFITVIYGVYMLATYLASRGIMRQAVRSR